MVLSRAVAAISTMPLTRNLVLALTLAMFAVGSSSAIRDDENTTSANISPSAVAQESDPEKLRAAADSGDREAQFLLGKAYWHGKGVPMDQKKAVEYYRQAAAMNHADALAGLGAAYGLGQGIEKRDEAAAAEYFRKAAELGSAIGQMNLGKMLITGKTLEKNTGEGVQWITKAAGQGLLQAQIYLGELYTVGESGIPRDYSRAIVWVRKAADQDDGRALNLYGVMLRDGLGVESDPAGAVRYFRRAGDKGYLKGFLNLGSAYFFGNGIEMDKISGMSWWFAGEELCDGACRETAARLVGGVKSEEVAKARELGKEMARQKLPRVVQAGLGR
jgi:TPR repeat protein